MTPTTPSADIVHVPGPDTGLVAEVRHRYLDALLGTATRTALRVWLIRDGAAHAPGHRGCPAATASGSRWGPVPSPWAQVAHGTVTASAWALFAEAGLLPCVCVESAEPHIDVTTYIDVMGVAALAHALENTTDPNRRFRIWTELRAVTTWRVLRQLDEARGVIEAVERQLPLSRDDLVIWLAADLAAQAVAQTVVDQTATSTSVQKLGRLTAGSTDLKSIISPNSGEVVRARALYEGDPVIAFGTTLSPVLTMVIRATAQIGTSVTTAVPFAVVLPGPFAEQVLQGPRWHRVALAPLNADTTVTVEALTTARALYADGLSAQDAWATAQAVTAD